MTTSNFAATVDRAALVAALGLFGKIVSKRSTCPIITHLLVECDGERATFTGTDLDIYATIALDAPASQPGKALVSCDQLKAGLAKSKGATVALQSVVGGVTLTLENGATTRLATACEIADWPAALPSLDKVGAAGEFATLDLRQELARVRPAVSTEETRYYLNGIYAHPLHGGRMAWAATDGHRLCVQQRDVPKGLELAPTILPRLAVDVIIAALAKSKAATASLAFGATAFRFEAGNVTIRSKVVDGTFPDYTRVIPSSRGRVLTVGAESLADSVSSVVAGLSGKTRGVRISMDSDGQWLTAAAQDADNNVAAMVIPGAEVSGDKGGSFVFGVNAPYLAGLARLFPGDVTLAIADDSAPMRLESPSLPDFVAVVMPLRVGGDVLSPAGIANMNRPAPTPLERLEEKGPPTIAALDKAGDDKGARKIFAAHLGVLITAAIDSLGGERKASRARVLAIVARMRGDETAAARIEAISAHSPGSTFGAWFAGLAPYQGPVFNVVQEAAPVAAQEAGQPGEVEALRALVMDLATRLARIEAGQASTAPQTLQERSPAHEAAIRRAWAERRSSRAARLARQETAKRFVAAEETIATVAAARDDFERIAIREGERADKAEAKVEILQTRVGRLRAVLDGRKSQLVRYARELLFARDRGAKLQRQLDEAAEGKGARATRSGYAIGRKAG